MGFGGKHGNRSFAGSVGLGNGGADEFAKQHLWELELALSIGCFDAADRGTIEKVDEVVR